MWWVLPLTKVTPVELLVVPAAGLSWAVAPRARAAPSVRASANGRRRALLRIVNPSWCDVDRVEMGARAAPSVGDRWQISRQREPVGKEDTDGTERRHFDEGGGDQDADSACSRGRGLYSPPTPGTV